MKDVLLLKNIDRSPARTAKAQEGGFSLVEVVVAMTILLIAVLGVFITFAYAVNYNAGNNSRSQALAVLQREVEQIRSKKFTPTPTITDADLSGGVKATRTVTLTNGNRFKIDITVDDNPLVDGVQINSATTFKEITISVSLDRPTPGWQNAVPATIILRRTRSN
jgi:prepilin-type N-terminal cleavage/methylation domain-containing protein